MHLKAPGAGTTCLRGRQKTGCLMVQSHASKGTAHPYRLMVDMCNAKKQDVPIRGQIPMLNPAAALLDSLVGFAPCFKYDQKGSVTCSQGRADTYWCSSKRI